MLELPEGTGNDHAPGVNVTIDVGTNPPNRYRKTELAAQFVKADVLLVQGIVKLKSKAIDLMNAKS